MWPKQEWSIEGEQIWDKGMRWCWKREGKKKIIKIYFRKQSDLVGTWVKTEFTYWEINKFGDKRKKEGKMKNGNYWLCKEGEYNKLTSTKIYW